jgi:hypothetical protein
LIFIENQADASFIAPLSPTPVAREIWILLYKPAYFEYEGWINVYDLPYLSELVDTDLRLQLASTAVVNI